jgi:hypothetical protein
LLAAAGAKGREVSDVKARVGFKAKAAEEGSHDAREPAGVPSSEIGSRRMSDELGTLGLEVEGFQAERYGNVGRSRKRGRALEMMPRECWLWPVG